MTFRTYTGNTHTENGWRICNSDQCVTLWYAGKPVLVRDGDAATVLKWWIDWYNANVEPIKSQIWGWSATNDVPGTPGRNDGSNHLSGTGIDLNAPWHPWTVDASRNFTPGQIAAIRRGLALAEGNLFWGQDWGRKDPMHFQLNGGTALGNGASVKLAAFAQKIRDGKVGSGGTTTSPGSPSSRPTLRRGDRGEHVHYLQGQLNRMFASYSKLAVDGDFGPATESVVREVQRRSGLAVDGIVGPDTWRASGVR
ncbi:peptidoglycan-binding protein [Rhodococcus sp. YH3-3]|uniref:peptidoglycan-binding protein n=1 Tax=Rhodococcus sp. YH3-3 TaxID=1803579 RepID=UPI0007DB5C9A|nr:peptidoglycan-binding protein [Rhodococcus sp. YH3-3]